MIARFARACLLSCYPPAFRSAHRQELLRFWAMARQEPRFSSPLVGPLRYWWTTSTDVVRSAIHLRLSARWGSGDLGRGRGPRRWPTDLRQAMTVLRRQRGASALVVVTLALGIGSTTAVFSVVEGVLLRDLPYEDVSSLRLLWQTRPANDPLGLAPGTALDLRDRSTAWASLALVRPSTPQSLALAGAPPETVDTKPVSANFFAVLGTGPLLGPGFSADADQPERPLEIVLSHGFWTRRFDQDPELIGQALPLGGQDYTVVGVMPAAFTFPLFGAEDVWVPRVLTASDVATRGYHSDRVIVRRAAGVDDAQVAADLRRQTLRLHEEMPTIHSELNLMAEPLDDAILGPVRPALTMLFVAVFLVMIIACANVANLQLARYAGRQSELRLRLALGAGRGQLLRQLFFEALALATLAALVGVGLAALLLPALLGLVPAEVPRLDRVGIDPTVLLFTLALTVVATVLFGVAPAVRTVSQQGRAGSQAGSGRTTLDRRGRRLLSTVIAIESALVAILLVGAGLFMRTVVSILDVDPGFDAANRIAVTLHLPPGRAKDVPTITSVLDDLLPRVRALPGVVQAGATTNLPLGGSAITIWAPVIHGQPRPEQALWAGWDTVTPGYFDAIGMRLVSGRAPDSRDSASAQKVIVLNEALARALFGTEPAVARHVSFGTEPYEVIGVVGDVHHTGLRDAARPAMYVPQPQATFPWPVLDLVIQAAPGATAVAMSGMREAVAASIPGQAITDLRTLDRVVSHVARQERFQMVMLSGFALVALALGAVGVYGLVSYGTRVRFREIAIRLTLGEPTHGIWWAVLRSGVGPVAAGLAFGVFATLVFGRVLQRFLFGVSAVDVATISAVVGILLLVVAAASWLPARVASRLDPARVLREG